MGSPETAFADPADYSTACCDPELPHDTAEDIFLDARARVPLPLQLQAFQLLMDRWSLMVFAEFWKDWSEQEGGHGASRSFGDEAAIRLLQTLTGSHDRKMAMKAECYLAVINRKEESQTHIAKKYGVTKAAISKVITGIKDNLDLPTARHMKSEDARESYRVRATKIHNERKQITCKQPTSNSFSRLSTSKSALMQTLVGAS
jgi:hypothetical protein